MLHEKGCGEKGCGVHFMQNPYPGVAITPKAAPFESQMMRY
jgi:hypothetical protein